MILSNDQKHTFTAFGARAFMRKEETTTEGEEEEITSFFHARAAFLPFLYARTPAVTNFCWSFLKKEIFRPGRFVVLRRSLVSATLLLFECFCSVCSIQFSHFIRTTTKNAYIIVLLYHREGRERERKRKVRNSSPLFRRIVAKPVQQNKKEIERLRELHKTQKKRIVFCTQFGANF
jgi:hypothetical protein